MNEEKLEFRKRFKTLRNGLNPEDRARWSAQICENIAALAQNRRYHRIGAFWPYGSEVDLRPLVHAHPDWVFVFPKVVSTSPPRLAWGPEPLEPGLFGLQEPVIAQHFLPPVQLLLVPGLAFDERGFRLGYGGVGFEAQRSAVLPISPEDMPVDGLASEAGVHWFQ
jgi:5-formyltetrahydrofolate cyclo-ligase